MQSEKPVRLPRWFPSMTDIAFLMPMVFLYGGMRGAQTLLSDGDTGWHLRTGEWILAQGRVPERDIFSFTRAGEPWFAWEWLWDVAFAWLHLHAGMAAVVAVNSLVLAATFAFLYRLARRESESLVALAATLVAAAASAGHWLARPHLFTMLFTVIFVSILESTRASSRTRRLWILPPLMVLWTNLHGGFGVGLVLIGAYAAGECGVWLRRTGPEERRHAAARGRTYLYAGGACALATLVNPYFYRLHVHIARYLADGFYRANIMEFQSLNFQTGQARHFEVLLLLGAAAAFWRLRAGDLTWPLLFVLWGHLALESARNVEIFVVLAAAPSAAIVTAGLRRAVRLPLAGWLADAVRGLADLLREITVFDRGPRWYVASAVGVCGVAVLLWGAGGARWHAVYDARTFPVAAAAQLEKQGWHDHVFSEDLWGGYLIYRQYPRGRVFIDGRSDFYGAEFVGGYMRALGARDGWERYLSRYGVETVLLPPVTPLAAALKQSRQWRSVYDDGTAVIFRKAGAVALPEEQASAGL